MDQDKFKQIIAKMHAAVEILRRDGPVSMKNPTGGPDIIITADQAAIIINEIKNLVLHGVLPKEFRND